VLTAAGVSAFGADGFAESNDPHLVNLEIPLARLPSSFDGFRIAQLSDFHYEERFSAVPIRRAVAMVNRLEADLIVLTGDFVTVPVFKRRIDLKRAAMSAAPCAEILGQLRSALGSIAILGNHDASVWAYEIVGSLRDHGIRVLRNACVPLERGRDRIWMAGIDDLLKGRPDFGATIKAIPGGELTILLAHEPDFADHAAGKGIDLQLSGHSHGGQVWLPLIGAPWLPAMSRKYPRGLYRIGNLTLYTNLGIGTIRAPIRINCQPEVTLITLRAGGG
jgi:uncharacterized protein